MISPAVLRFRNFLLLALVVAGVIYVIGEVTGEVTGVTTTPALRYEFSIGAGEEAEVASVLEDFALAEGLTFEASSGMLEYEGRRVLMLNLDGAPFRVRLLGNAKAAGHIFVFVYGSPAEPGFDAFEARLTSILRERWPDLAPYTGP